MRGDNDDEDQDSIPYDPPALDVFLKPVSYYENSMILPAELMNIIFEFVLKCSDKPLNDLCNLSKVCNSWRLICLSNPRLWARVDLSLMPMTDRNVKKLKLIFMSDPPRTKHIRELTFSRTNSLKDGGNITFIESLISAPNLQVLTLRDVRSATVNSWPSIINRSIKNCTHLKALNITDSGCCFNNQKWLADFISTNGNELEELNLAMSLKSISGSLFKALSVDYCPRLKLLDLSTSDNITTHSFDALSLTQKVPNLEILRLGNVSFKRIGRAPEKKGLKKLRELSIPTAARDADRDDPLIATLTYGSQQVSSLDLRGSSVSPFALVQMPSNNVKELHMDDVCPINRPRYEMIIQKWAHSLQTLSLIKINCSDTIKKCLEVLRNQTDNPQISDLDLATSYVDPIDLKNFILSVKSLEKINLASCRSLPRGCKGQFWRDPSKISRSSILESGIPLEQRSFKTLLKRLDTSTDEEVGNRRVPKRRATRNSANY